MAKKRFKKLVRKAHLYLGLASGIVVFIVSITGACWAFKDEILELIEEPHVVEKQEKGFITATQAQQAAQKVFPDKLIHGAIFAHKTDPLEVVFYEADPVFYRSVFLNPYTGEYLGEKDHTADFFGFVLDGHVNLWLPAEVGSQITAYGTMIFVIMLISGIILWWPKNKKGRKQRLKFDWKNTTKWRRKNFDLHSVVGFYLSLFALVISFSGLIMAFGWIYYITYLAWGGDKNPRFILPNNTSIAVIEELDSNIKPIDDLVPKLMVEMPNYQEIEIHYPESDTSSILVEVPNGEGIHYNMDYRFFDQNTLEELESPAIYGKYENTSVADKMIRMNYDIHVGAIGGLAGKILAFVISLITASLPVTGTLLWWGRKKKGENK